MLFDLRGIVGLLSPKAIFILAWGNAPGFGVRIPGAMPLAMLIMAVGQSERIPGAMPGAMVIMAVGQSRRIPGAMPLAMVIMAVGQSVCPLFASCRITATGQSYFDQNRA